MGKRNNINPSDKRNLKKKLGEKCVYCGCTNPLILTLDHRNPLKRGGEDTEQNKQVTCWVCNQLKGALTHAEFKTYMVALKKLHKLAKVNIVLPQYLEVKFSQNHHPDFVYYVDKPKNLKNSGDNNNGDDKKN